MTDPGPVVDGGVDGWDDDGWDDDPPVDAPPDPGVGGGRDDDPPCSCPHQPGCPLAGGSWLQRVSRYFG